MSESDRFEYLDGSGTIRDTGFVPGDNQHLTIREAVEVLNRHDRDLRDARAQLDKVSVWLCDWDEDTDSVEELVMKVCGIIKHRGDDLLTARATIEDYKTVVQVGANQAVERDASIAELVGVAVEYAGVINCTAGLWDFGTHERVMNLISRHKVEP